MPEQSTLAGRLALEKGFEKRKNVSPGVLLDVDPVVHLVDPQELRIPAVTAKLVILAHDERFDRLGRAHFGTQAAEAAP